MTAANEDVSRNAVDTYGRAISFVMDWPPIPGRLSMLLMLTGRPLTIQEIRDYLSVSFGSVSESTRLLIKAGVIERTKIAGQRRHCFRWREDAWVGCIRHQADQLATIREVAVDALRNTDLTDAQLASFRQMLDFYSATSTAMDNIARHIAKSFAETGRYSLPDTLLKPELSTPVL